MKYLVTLSFLLLCTLWWQRGLAQHHDPDLVQFTGVVVAADSLQPIPYCDITVQNTKRTTTTDYNGYFSFVAHKKDRILFSAMGFESATFIIPDTITRDRYSLIQALTSDTILLGEALIYPWPSVEQFREAFVKLNIPDDDLEIARKNMAKEEIRARAEAMPMDAAMNYRNVIDQRISKLYYIGQPQPITLLNPIAWAQFIKAWREGKFKRKK